MLFSPWRLGTVGVPNRLVRAATYEGMADADGRPSEKLGELYGRLAKAGTGVIITGFCAVHAAGRAMQPRQARIDSDDQLPAWAAVVARVRAASPEAALIMQLAHTGRQTIPAATGERPWAPSARRSPYFRARPRAMREDDIALVIAAFAAAALRAQGAGFSGVQLHAAHGYLLHQFLSPHLNRRTDRWGVDRLAFLAEIVSRIQRECGSEFPLLIKISGEDFHPGGLTPTLAAQYVARMESWGIAAIEVSCGTMDAALNIFRGALPLERVLAHNPFIARKPAYLQALWKRFALPRLKRDLRPFTENYNLPAARAIRNQSAMPLILVGGIRSLTAMEALLARGEVDAISLCRPFVCEPDLAARLKEAVRTGRDRDPRARCINCNACAIMCDTSAELRCYREE